MSEVIFLLISFTLLAKKTDLVTLTKVFNDCIDNIYTSLDAKDILTLIENISKYSIVGQDGFPLIRRICRGRRVCPSRASRRVNSSLPGLYTGMITSISFPTIFSPQTLPICPGKYPNVQVYHLSKREFDHGGTRRRGVEHSQAEIFAFMIPPVPGTHPAGTQRTRWNRKKS